MSNKYNYCAQCHQWLGWPRYLAFWEKKQLCEDCQRPNRIIIL